MRSIMPCKPVPLWVIWVSKPGLWSDIANVSQTSSALRCTLTGARDPFRRGRPGRFRARGRAGPPGVVDLRADLLQERPRAQVKQHLGIDIVLSSIESEAYQGEVDAGLAALRGSPHPKSTRPARSRRSIRLTFLACCSRRPPKRSAN